MPTSHWGPIRKACQATVCTSRHSILALLLIGSGNMPSSKACGEVTSLALPQQERRGGQG